MEEPHCPCALGCMEKPHCTCVLGCMGESPLSLHPGVHGRAPLPLCPGRMGEPPLPLCPGVYGRAPTALVPWGAWKSPHCPCALGRTAHKPPTSDGSGTDAGRGGQGPKELPKEESCGQRAVPRDSVRGLVRRRDPLRPWADCGSPPGPHWAGATEEPRPTTSRPQGPVPQGAPPRPPPPERPSAHTPAVLARLPGPRSAALVPRAPRKATGPRGNRRSGSCY